MQQTIDINLLKENPKLFFSQLPENAKAEITEFLRFIVFKYKIDKGSKETDFLSKVANHKFTLPSDYKFNREEANER